MANAVIMPRQGQSVESCIITRWHKKPGDTVAQGDLLFSYETDKAAFDEEAQQAGTLLAAFFGEGDDVPVLTNVCVIGDAGEDVSAFAPEGAAASAPVPSPQAAPAQASATQAPAQASATQAPAAAPAQSATTGGTAPVSPRARNLAAKAGVDAGEAQSSGPQGRIIARDVEALIDAKRDAAYAQPVQPAAQAPQAASAPQAAAPSAPGTVTWRDEPMSNMRKSISKAMRASLQGMAQLTHTTSFDCTDILRLRARFKNEGEALGMAGITLNDMVNYAVVRTLEQHAALNAHRYGDSMRFFDDVHLGMAVDTPRGLMVPTIFFANRKSLLELSKESKELAAACQKGNVSPDALTGGTFTVSNLGALGVEHFTPVINPPQTGILGVNTITQKVREGKNGIEVYSSMSLSLTYDHCALDGAPASRFLQDLARNLERFSLLLAR